MDLVQFTKVYISRRLIASSNTEISGVEEDLEVEIAASSDQRSRMRSQSAQTPNERRHDLRPSQIAIMSPGWVDAISKILPYLTPDPYWQRGDSHGTGYLATSNKVIVEYLGTGDVVPKIHGGDCFTTPLLTTTALRGSNSTRLGGAGAEIHPAEAQTTRGN
jgi:hypothetical protein